MNPTSIDKQKPELIIGKNSLGEHHPVYFIADIAANHDGDLERAKSLIYLSAEAGAHAAKFQHFNASTIVSDFEFKRNNKINSHQSYWKKSVYQTYQAASVDLNWSETLKKTCEDAGIEFMTSPYSYQLADILDPYLNTFKIGSGDITWIDFLQHLAAKQKPLIIATGASNFEDVVRAIDSIEHINKNICLMQCNTNYTGNVENFKYLNLRVLKCYRQMYPNYVLGLSDHTPGYSAVLGAVALGARVIEKHFTDSNQREGPDHKFSLTPIVWREMVDATIQLDFALGTGIKRIEENEKSTAILQRRSLCASRDIKPGETIVSTDLIPLRPCPPNSFAPYQLINLVGKTVIKALCTGQSITGADIN